VAVAAAQPANKPHHSCTCSPLSQLFFVSAARHHISRSLQPKRPLACGLQAPLSAFIRGRRTYATPSHSTGEMVIRGGKVRSEAVALQSIPDLGLYQHLPFPSLPPPPPPPPPPSDTARRASLPWRLRAKMAVKLKRTAAFWMI
jgi:hypothetical protein